MPKTRVVFHFTDTVPCSEGARVAQEGSTQYVLMCPDLTTTPEGRERLAHAMSVAVTRTARDEWVHLGSVPAV